MWKSTLMRCNLTPISPNFVGKFCVTDVTKIFLRNSKTFLIRNIIRKDAEFQKCVNELMKQQKKIQELYPDYAKIKQFETLVKNELNKVISNTTKISDEYCLTNYILNGLKFLIEIVKQRIDGKLSNSEENELKKYLLKRIRCERGILMHSKVMDSLRKLDYLHIDQDERIYELNTDYYKIKGRIDGIDIKNNELIEIKTRLRNRSIVYVEDQIQCQIYLKLTGYNQLALYEHFPNNKIERRVIKYNKQMFDYVDESLKTIVKIVRLLNSRDLYDLMIKK